MQRKQLKKYEKRQAEIKQLEKELSFRLKQFSHVKFQVNKKEGEVLFTGLHTKTNKLVIGKSKCDKKDKFEVAIGKIIAVKKAMKEDIEDVIKLVEPSLSVVIDSFGIYGGSITTNSEWGKGLIIK